MQIRIIQSKSIILLAVLFISGCAFENLEFTKGDALNVAREAERDGATDFLAPVGSEPMPTVNLERDFGKHALGTKAFNQIYLGMQTLTGIQANSFNSIRNQYDNFRASFPTSNDLSAFSATNVLAVFNLAFEFCDVIANNQGVRNAFFANTFFMNANNSVALVDLDTDDRRYAFVDHLLLRFLGNEVSSLEHRDLMRAELLSLIVDLRTPTPPANNNQRRNLWASVCTAALGSASVNLF